VNKLKTSLEDFVNSCDGPFCEFLWGQLIVFGILTVAAVAH